MLFVAQDYADGRGLQDDVMLDDQTISKIESAVFAGRKLFMILGCDFFTFRLRVFVLNIGEPQ